MANTYDTGDRIEITTSTVFQDSDGSAFDPDVVTFTVKEPGAASEEYVYNTDAEVTRNGTGDYTCTIDVDTSGRWYYRIEGETSGSENRGADEGTFYVRPSGV
jgi:hypothetical protein